MNTVLDIVLAPEVLAGGLMLAALVFAARAVVVMTGEATELRLRLAVVEARLAKVNDGIPDKKKRIAEHTKVVSVMQPVEQRLRTYYDQLSELNIEAEKAEHEAEERERTKRERKGPRRDSPVS